MRKVEEQEEARAVDILTEKIVALRCALLCDQGEKALLCADEAVKLARVLQFAGRAKKPRVEIVSLASFFEFGRGKGLVLADRQILTDIFEVFRASAEIEIRKKRLVVRLLDNENAESKKMLLMSIAEKNGARFSTRGNKVFIDFLAVGQAELW
ncbi:MAG: hypothetical protein LBM97_01585 [Candidatus Nomurabacteria bacterium]|jgi:hypothetical protein|nr:hypothetical protein [Candidatus Nomurabacteria bacterium]